MSLLQLYFYIYSAWNEKQVIFKHGLILATVMFMGHQHLCSYIYGYSQGQLSGMQTWSEETLIFRVTCH